MTASGRKHLLLACAVLLAAASCSSGGAKPGADAAAATDGGAESRLDVLAPSDVPVTSDAIPDAPTSDAPTSDAPTSDAKSDTAVNDAGGLDRGSTDGRADVPGNDAGGCAANLIRCDNTCIDPTSDLKHCGATPGCGTNGSSFGMACTNGSACSTLVVKSRSFATGTKPEAVAVADLNGDGRADLAVANGGSSDVSVLLGNGDGTFQDAVTFAAHSGPQTIAAGDLNGDGKLDLVVGNNGSGDVSVLLGNGDGTFKTHTDIPIADQPYELALADLNGDGRLDLAVACGGTQSVYVLLGAGNGTFTADVQLTTTEVGTGGIAGVAAGDLNGDGKVDLAINNERAVDVFLGNGDGSFHPRTEAYFASGSALAFGDLDGDGKPDILAEALQGAILLSAKDDWMITSSAGDVNLSDTANSIALADLDGDGKLDIAATSFYPVVVRLGNGDGTFKPPQLFTGGSNVGSIVVHDFDGDGRPDFVITDSGEDAVVVMLSGTAPLACR